MVYLFLADGFEEVEALTPLDYLRRCEVEVQIVGISGLVIRGSHGIRVMADILPTQMNLPEAEIPEEIRLTADLKTAMAEKDILVMAVPSVYVRSTAARMRECLR